MRRRNLPRDADEQLQILAQLAAQTADQLGAEQLESVFVIAAQPVNAEVQMRAAVLLSELYPTLAPNDAAFAQRTHTILLRDLLQPRKAMAHPSCSWLVMTHLREENLAHIPWQSAEEVASAAECFYGFCEAGLPSEESHRRVRDLVKYAGLRFAEQDRWDELFELLSRIHLPADMMDADLFRLRNTLVLYEQRRVQRLRRRLFQVLVGVAAFLALVSPVVFMASDNGVRRSLGMNPLTYSEALYWSIITFSTVGYGEIVPHTTVARVLAICDSLLGITVMGIIAGLILSHVTPRRLP